MVKRRSSDHQKEIARQQRVARDSIFEYDGRSRIRQEMREEEVRRVNLVPLAGYSKKVSSAIRTIQIGYMVLELSDDDRERMRYAVQILGDVMNRFCDDQ